MSPIKSYPESLIRKKLEDFNIKPQGEPSKSIEEFLKSDLTVFMGNVSPDLSPQDAKPSEQNFKTTKSISDLPYEILSKILSFLDLKSKFRFSEVCRIFQSITMDPLLYHEVNLKFYWHLADSFLMKSITKRCTLTQKLDMSCCGFNNKITFKDFEDFIKCNGKSLTSLRLNSAYFLRYSCLQAISIHCFLLSELSLQNYANMTAERNYQCLFYLSNLKTLNLSQSGINQPDLLNILKNNKNLEKLILSFPIHQINMDEISIVIHSFNKKMKCLNFWKSSTLSNLGLRALSKSFNLEELNMGWCFREDSNITESMRLLTQNCKNMKKLVLTAIRSINERDLENLSTCSKLEQLDLTGIIGVTLENCLR